MAMNKDQMKDEIKALLTLTGASAEQLTALDEGLAKICEGIINHIKINAEVDPDGTNANWNGKIR